MEPIKNDWRNGQKVQAKGAYDKEMFGDGKVLGCYPSGYYGIECADGVLSIQLADGRILTDKASN